MDTPPLSPEPHRPGDHCFVVTSEGRHRPGLMVRWGQQPVDTGRKGDTEHHADVYYLDLDPDTHEWVVRHEWVHASRIIGGGNAGRGGHTSRQT